MIEPASRRVANEVAHGQWIAEADPESVWGWGTPAGRVRAERRAQLLAQGGHLHAGARVLEVGCGSGLFTKMLAASGAKIVAVDVSAELIAMASRNCAGASVTLHVGAFEDLDLGEGFDAVVGSSVRHHLDVERALSRIGKLLKPGGAISFAEPNMLNPQVFAERHAKFLPLFRYVSPDETAFTRWGLMRTLMRHGFDDIAITPLDWLHPATPVSMMGVMQQVGGVFERLPGACSRPMIGEERATN